MLSEVFKSGISHIDSVDFRRKQIRKYKDQTRALAMKAAQEKASAMAREIGQTIGKAHSIEEQNDNRFSNTSSNIRGAVGESYSEAESTIALAGSPFRRASL